MPEAISTILDVDDWEAFQEPPPHSVHTLGSVALIKGRRLGWPNTLVLRKSPSAY
jgi:hypothetical protein